jgi:hypothetical protein
MTEGLRPLGRLALVDCSSQTFQRIRQCLKKAIAPESVEETSKRTKMSFDGKQVRVFIVGSTAGGTASGMAIDLGYGVQEILARLGVQNATITALLTHSTARNTNANDLAKVNTFAFLNELQHFCRTDSVYPGEPSCNISPAQAGQPPFHYTYLTHLGDNLTEDDLVSATKQIAEYIGLNGFSSCGSFFNVGRKTPMDPARNLRTFSMHRISCVTEPIIETWTNRICSRLVNLWIGEDEDTGQRTTLNQKLTAPAKGEETAKNDARMKRLASTYSAQAQFNVETLVKKAFEVYIVELRNDPEGFHDQVLADVLPKNSDDRDWQTISLLFETINSVFGIEDPFVIDSSTYPELLERSLEAQVRRVTARMGTELRAWILEQADQSGCRIAGAIDLTKCFEEHFSQLEKSAHHNSTKILADLRQFVADAQVACQGDPRQTNELTGLPLRSLTLRYYRLILNRLAIHATMRMASGLSSAVSAISEELYELRREMKQFAKRFSDIANEVQSEFEAGEDKSGEFSSLWKYAVSNLRNRQAELCIQLDRDVRRECLDEDYSGLFDLIMQRGDLEDRLSDNMRLASRKCVIKSLDGIDAISQMIKSSETPNQLCLQIYRCFEDVQPKLLEHGGAKQLLLGLLLSAQGNQKVEVLKKVLGENVTLAFNSDNDVTLCCEVSGVPLASVAAGIIENRTDYADYAERLHVRTDVDWSTLLND